MGPATVLSYEDEYALEKWIFTSAKASFPSTKDQLLDSVQLILKETKKTQIRLKTIHQEDTGIKVF